MRVYFNGDLYTDEFTDEKHWSLEVCAAAANAPTGHGYLLSTHRGDYFYASLREAADEFVKRTDHIFLARVRCVQ